LSEFIRQTLKPSFLFTISLKTNVIFYILLAFAGGLIAPDVLVWAQEAVNVTDTEGQTEEVPTLEQAISNSITAMTALISAIIALAGLIIKSGILDRWVSKKRQAETFDSVQMGFLNMKGVLEDKVLQKFLINNILEDVPEDRREKYRPMVENLNEQIAAKTEQIDFYAKKWSEHVKEDQFRHVSPDLQVNLPREETTNIAYTLDTRIPKRITFEKPTKVISG
jgi:hypothetical protein